MVIDKFPLNLLAAVTGINLRSEICRT